MLWQAEVTLGELFTCLGVSGPSSIRTNVLFGKQTKMLKTQNNAVTWQVPEDLMCRSAAHTGPAIPTLAEPWEFITYGRQRAPQQL